MVGENLDGAAVVEREVVALLLQPSVPKVDLARVPVGSPELVVRVVLGGVVHEVADWAAVVAQPAEDRRGSQRCNVAGRARGRHRAGGSGRRGASSPAGLIVVAAGGNGREHDKNPYPETGRPPHISVGHQRRLCESSES